MPELRQVQLFTFHAYASWLPDREQGYFLNKSGLQPPNSHEADWYRRLQSDDPVRLEDTIQQHLVDACREAARPLRLTPFGVATDPSHLHVLLAWSVPRAVQDIRRSFKHGLSKALNDAFGPRPWFGRGGHDRRVRDRDHFVYLRDEYLPDHPGRKWDGRVGNYQRERSLKHLRESSCSPASRSDAAT